MAENKYVIFKINSEEYGVDIMKVKEVSEFKKSVSVPNAPSFVDGIINLRGDITPIISLKKRFGIIDDRSADESSRIIVVNIQDKLVGFVVDEASQVISIEDSSIDPPPPVVVGVDKKYIHGIGKLDERMIILLDLEKVLNEQEKNIIGEMDI
ncbi:purine-binding chemotaxis protein CheW [Peptoclostridium litorale DSM 5388]|uniref:Putative CheW protein n=1 Tax=Peptoclostridium litorale DSM 5388 TaxID=1121324 RepID=A0A069RH79_PEPLI|nr:chemotaxis protein CheW [Peptoclostridium litorale]KDR96113.1 putative CheW protein [Peptoclostridium litorale DSM 5388]SIO04371.1 purine-binding chemotaxis protein CheW [Peptoclostridium litorale DSM 5388]